MDELKFASEDEAFQYLANLTNQRIFIALINREQAEAKHDEMIQCLDQQGHFEGHGGVKAFNTDLQNPDRITVHYHDGTKKTFNHKDLIKGGRCVPLSDEDIDEIENSGDMLASKTASKELKDEYVKKVKHQAAVHLLPKSKGELLSMLPERFFEQHVVNELPHLKGTDVRTSVRVIDHLYKRQKGEYMGSDLRQALYAYFHWHQLVNGGYDYKLRYALENAVDHWVGEFKKAGYEVSPDALEDYLIIEKLSPMFEGENNYLKNFRSSHPSSLTEYISNALNISSTEMEKVAQDVMVKEGIPYQEMERSTKPPKEKMVRTKERLKRQKLEEQARKTEELRKKQEEAARKRQEKREKEEKRWQETYGQYGLTEKRVDEMMRSEERMRELKRRGLASKLFASMMKVDK